jgi:hypothetical protein
MIFSLFGAASEIYQAQLSRRAAPDAIFGVFRRKLANLQRVGGACIVVGWVGYLMSNFTPAAYPTADPELSPLGSFCGFRLQR